MFVPHRKHVWATTACYGDCFTFLCVDDVLTSLETHLWISTICYGDGFTLLYADDVRTSQEARVWTTVAYIYDTCSRGIVEVSSAWMPQKNKQTKTNSVAFSPRAKYTD
jgi:hypothetical protein